MQQKGPKNLENPALNLIGLELKPRLKNGSARCGTLPDGRVSLRGAGTLLSVANRRKNGAVTAIFEGLEVQTPNSGSTAPTRAVAVAILTAACCGYRTWLVVTKIHACGRLSHSDEGACSPSRGSWKSTAPSPGPAPPGSGGIRTSATHKRRLATHTPSLRWK